MKTLLKYIMIILTLPVILSACSTDPFIEYEDHNGIYFEKFEERRPVKVPNLQAYYYKKVTVDSLRYSFKMDEEDSGAETFVAWVKVKINGIARGEDLTFRLERDPSSTAVEGVHLDALEREYTFRKGVYVDSLPVTFYKSAMPEKGAVTLVLNMVAGEGMPPVIRESSQIRLNVSNDYFKPWYWDQYMDFNLKYYHPLKLEKVWSVLKTKQVVEWRMTNASSAWDSKVGGECYWYFKDNEILDEDGIRVTVD